MGKWILVLMIWGAGTADSFSIAVSPHGFETEKQCKAFVAELRRQHELKRIDASCIEQYTRHESKGEL